MRLLEKLRSQPGWQDDDPMVRIEAVRGLPEDEDTDSVLSDVARGDVDARVRGYHASISEKCHAHVFKAHLLLYPAGVAKLMTLSRMLFNDAHSFFFIF